MTSSEPAQIVAALYESHYASLVRYACRATGTVENAEEMVQESFLQLYEALREGRRIDNPAAWTFIAVRHMVLRQVRDHRSQKLDFHGGDVLDTWPAALPDTNNDAAGDLTRLLHLLSRREEEVLLLRLSSLRYEEIAAELGIGAKAVSTLLSRAVQKLRKAMRVPSRKRTATLAAEVKDDESDQPKRTLQ